MTANSRINVGCAGTADLAVALSQGAITDRSWEFLCDSDRALIKLRRLLIDAAKAYEAGETPAVARHESIAYGEVWVGDKTLAPGEDWR